MKGFDGLGTHIGNLWRLSEARSRSISAENPTGEKGGGAKAVEGVASRAARGLGQGWKVDPFVRIPAGATHTMADIQGPGVVQHVWLTPALKQWRFAIIRIYWDDQQIPSVECPVGDFFACGWQEYAQVSSLAVCINPGSALNCYWEMPFRRRCRITMSNIGDDEMVLYYQVDYALTEVPDDAAYFHASFRRQNPLPFGEVVTILDGVRGRGQFVGTCLAWGVNNSGWWGEGEVKFYIDGDGEFPTICGTGTEDYFCGSYNFEHPKSRQYEPFTTPYAGMSLLRPDGLYRSQMRFSLYRWHIPDPVRFQQDLRVTIQALGWRGDGRYLPLQDDVASVGFWYQSLPTAKLPDLPPRDQLEVI